MWLPVALWCKTLPLRVTRKRFAVALWLFIFGICSPFVCCGGDRLGRRLERRHVLGGWLEGRGLLGRVARGARLLLRQIFQVPLVRSDHHDHVSALLLGHRLDDGEFPEVSDETIQDLSAEVRVGHLAPAEHDRDLDLVPRREEPRDMPFLGGVVVRVDLGAELDLLEAGPRLFLACLFELDVSFVFVLAVVHDPAHRRIGLRRDLDEIQLERPGLAQRVAGIDHADLLAVRPDEANLWRPDPVVDPGICRNPASPLRGKRHRPRRCTSNTRTHLRPAVYVARPTPSTERSAIAGRRALHGETVVLARVPEGDLQHAARTLWTAADAVWFLG